MINILLILSIFLFVPILGIPDSLDIYIYLFALGLLCFEWLRLWRTSEVFRSRIMCVRKETKKFIKSFFKEEKIEEVQGQEEQEVSESETKQEGKNEK